MIHAFFASLVHLIFENWFLFRIWFYWLCLTVRSIIELKDRKSCSKSLALRLHIYRIGITLENPIKFQSLHNDTNLLDDTQFFPASNTLFFSSAYFNNNSTSLQRVQQESDDETQCVGLILVGLNRTKCEQEKKNQSCEWWYFAFVAGKHNFVWLKWISL